MEQYFNLSFKHVLLLYLIILNTNEIIHIKECLFAIDLNV